MKALILNTAYTDSSLATQHVSVTAAKQLLLM